MGVTKYCTATPMTFDTIQYIDKPLGNWREKKAIIIGIIQSIIVWFDCCFGSVDGLTVNFCCTQVDTNTNAGIITRVGSGSARSNMPRKLTLRGTTAYIGNTGIQVYNFSESPIRSPGLENSVCINTRNKPIRMGI